MKCFSRYLPYIFRPPNTILSSSCHTEGTDQRGRVSGWVGKSGLLYDFPQAQPILFSQATRWLSFLAKAWIWQTWSASRISLSSTKQGKYFLKSRIMLQRWSQSWYNWLEKNSKIFCQSPVFCLTCKQVIGTNVKERIFCRCWHIHLPKL